MASLLAEQLEFDFFAPPEHEKPKADKKPTVSTAIKDADILNYQLTGAAAASFKISGKTFITPAREDHSTGALNLINHQDPRKKLENVYSSDRWIRSA